MSNTLKNQFEQLYQEHYRMVYRLCTGLLKGDGEQAKDLAQEVFIQVWNNLDRFRQDSSPKTWIYRIAVNACLNYIKLMQVKSKRLEEASRSQAHSEEIKLPEEDPIKVLYEALAQLSDIDRLLAGLLLEGLPQSEIASIMGISEGNLRVKVHRIKIKLKKLIPHG